MSDETSGDEGAWGMPLARRLTEAQKRIVAARVGWRCEMCGEALASHFQCDHIIPLWEGGADSTDNCQALCANCHASKTQQEALRRAARKRSLREAACHPSRPPIECTGCGVVFSPYFSHRCGTHPQG